MLSKSLHRFSTLSLLWLLLTTLSSAAHAKAFERLLAPKSALLERWQQHVAVGPEFARTTASPTHLAPTRQLYCAAAAPVGGLIGSSKAPRTGRRVKAETVTLLVRACGLEASLMS